MNPDELLVILVSAIINGTMLAIGMVIGSKLTSKSLVKELDKYLGNSKLFQAIKELITDQQLTDKATKFFEEATELVGSPEAKNFFKNITELIKKLSENQHEKTPMPPPQET
jgi:hypothetical protein